MMASLEFGAKETMIGGARNRDWRSGEKFILVKEECIG